MIATELHAQIRRLFFAEHWRVHTIATQLGVRHDLTPQRLRLIDMAARASVMLDHVDAWVFAQRSLVHKRTRHLLPIYGLPLTPKRAEFFREVTGRSAYDRRRRVAR